jgi:prevent-host-death family protein
MESMSTVQARSQFAELVNRAAYGRERIILTRRGKQVVAIVPIDDLRFLEEVEDRLDLERAKAALAEADDEGTVSWEALKTELGL